MSRVMAFRLVYIASLLFGTFPYEPRHMNTFYLSEQILRRAKFLFSILLITRGIVLVLAMRENEHENFKNLMVLVRLENTCTLEILAIIVHKNVFTHCDSICNWLNQMSHLYASMLGDFREIFKCNRFIICYSLGFFTIINLPMFVMLLSTGKFISGPIASFDCVTFVFLLLLQNVYLAQFMAFANLARVCFSRVNDILREDIFQGRESRMSLRKLRKLRAQHLKATDFYSFINSVFESYVFFYTAWSFQSVFGCTIILVTAELADFITIYLWMWHHVFQDLPILFVCEWVSKESKRSANCMNELISLADDPEVKEEVEIFSLQLQHRPAEFNVWGLFILDCKLFITVAGIIVTYVIAFIQVHSTPPHHQTNSTNIL